MTETMEFDILIIGAGPAGLSAAIRLRQHAAKTGRDISVCILEKGSEVGAHILSGCAFEPRALNELLPDWKALGAPLHTPITQDAFQLLTKKRALKLPVPPAMKNHGNYIISLAELCRWLGKQAEALGAQIFPGFPATKLLLEEGEVKGVITGEFGRAKNGSEKPGFQPCMHIRARYTLFAEGCRGSLSEELMRTFNLRRNAAPQTYGLGIKEIWEIPRAQHKQGHVLHTIGWPLDTRTYGGSFVYHMADNQIAIGYIVGLDYQNPHLDPYQEFQRFKTHPAIAHTLAGGKRIAYGARALNEGGLQSIPKLVFPGGALIGDAAGFLNVAKIKGSHTSMYSGMLAGDAAAEALAQATPPSLLSRYPESLKKSWVWEELSRARNIRPGFHLGLLGGLLNAAIDTYILRGKAPWTLRHLKPDNASLKLKTEAKPITYPKPDGVLTFDRMSSVYLSNTNHEEDQPCHLRLKDADIPIAHNLEKYNAPEQRYCPAGVYEIVEKEGAPALAIHAQNCVHCKTCDIKDPLQNIVWTTPEGAGGPNYGQM